MEFCVKILECLDFLNNKLNYLLCLVMHINLNTGNNTTIVAYNRLKHLDDKVKIVYTEYEG